jgi:hypothetical protein
MLIAKEEFYFCRFRIPFDVFTEVAMGIDLYNRDDR